MFAVLRDTYASDYCSRLIKRQTLRTSDLTSDPFALSNHRSFVLIKSQRHALNDITADVRKSTDPAACLFYLPPGEIIAVSEIVPRSLTASYIVYNML